MTDPDRGTTGQASTVYNVSIPAHHTGKSKQDHDGVYITQLTNESLLSVCIVSDNDSEDNERRDGRTEIRTDGEIERLREKKKKQRQRQRDGESLGD